MPHADTALSPDWSNLTAEIRHWGLELGFQQIGISDGQLDAHETQLLNWLDDGCHGEMDYMARHGTKRSRPAELLPGTTRIISVRMDYLPPDARPIVDALNDPDTAYFSRYALGRDYHKLMRNRLQKLAQRITDSVGDFGYRAFVDSAPVLEKALAERAGLGWIGKHSNLINRRAGSWFFLGELYTDLPLPVDPPHNDEHCGRCTACIDICPTAAIVAPYRVDARRCISYLTIELRGSIPEEFRSLIGNRVYGCDDCQLVCPWNRFARHTEEADYRARQGLDNSTLSSLFGWSQAEFEERLAGSPIRRIGYTCWLRNLAVGLGNAPTSAAVLAALESRRDDPSALVREHVGWALAQHRRG